MGKTPNREKKNVTIQLPVEPTGIIAPPAVEPVAQPIVLPATIESPAATIVADAAANDKPLAVPATVVVDPNAPSHEKVEKFNRLMHRVFEAFYRSRPLMDNLPAAVALLTDEQVEELGMAYKAAQAALTPPVKVSLVAAFDHIRAINAAEIAAADKARGSQSPIDNAWVDAALKSIDGLRADVAKLGATKQRSAKPKNDATDAPSVRATSAKWSELGPKLIAQAEKLGLSGVVFVDKTEGGYKGSYHAVKVHSDGRLERCDYDQATHAVTPLGEFVNSPIWFNDAGDMFSKGDKRPGYSLLRDGMFGVLMTDAKNNVLMIEGLNFEGKAKHLMPVSLFYTDAGVAVSK